MVLGGRFDRNVSGHHYGDCMRQPASCAHPAQVTACPEETFTTRRARTATLSIRYGSVSLMPRPSAYFRAGDEAYERVRAVVHADRRSLSNQLAVACERASDSVARGKQSSNNDYLGEALR
jgi:hypothetical protein